MLTKKVWAIKAENAVQCREEATAVVNEYLGGSHDVRPVLARETPIGASLLFFDHLDATWWRLDLDSAGKPIGDGKLYLTDSPS